MRESRIQNPESRRGRYGFTLLELLVVIAIIAILVAILFPATQGMRQRARDREATANARALENAIRSFRAEYGYWPTSEANNNINNLTPDQGTVISNYLFSTASAKNPRGRPFWDVGGIVSNMATRLPMTIKIDVTNDTVTVNK